MASRRQAFTLVELLVVIGIITVLIAILLPALNMAREHANRVKCLATLRGMAQAAHAHAQEHRGHMPLAGMMVAGTYPDKVGDPSMTRYMYYKEYPGAQERDDGGPEQKPLPLTASLGHYMNLRVPAGSRAELQESLKAGSLIAHFVCPSDDRPSVGSTLFAPGGTWRMPDETMSYVFNEWVLGVRTPWGERGIGGNVGKVRRTSEVMLFADGKAGRYPPGLIPAGHPAYEVLKADAFNFLGDDSARTLLNYWNRHGNAEGMRAHFDAIRHRRRFNVVFVDGHAETLLLPPAPPQSGDGDLDRVGLSKGIYD
jgi:prepilin-type processing-associated H-X9-DG protein/prepilin-type N-terminal cleavage/methylation domain-containing protein